MNSCSSVKITRGYTMEINQNKKYTCSDFTVDKNAVEKVKSELLGDNEFEELSLFFKSISDKTRIKILYALSKSSLCVCEIAQLLDMSVSAISHQLRVLRQARLVRYDKKGKAVFYTLNDDHVNTVFENAIEHILE